MSGEVQDRLGASMIPHNSMPSPTIDSTAPIGSGRLGCGLRELGTRKAAAIRPAAATGTLTRKTEPHQKWTRRNPPRMGPMATPSPAVPDQIPMARARSPSPVKTLVRMERVQGISAAAPTPITTRAAVSRSGVGDHAASADPAAEDDQTGHEHPLASDPVPERAEGEQQTGEGDRVGVHDPLELAGRCTQTPERPRGAPR